MNETILKLESLSKSFAEVLVCKDLSFEVKKGTIHALIGPNGAGKTTALNLVTGLLQADRGNIFFNSQNITHLQAQKRARLGMSRVFQITSLFKELSLKENILVSLSVKERRGHKFWTQMSKDKQLGAQADVLLEKMGLIHRSNLLAGELSHGEQRQLEMGMALATDPKLLVLDEPMAGLGPGGSAKLSELIHELKSEYTILLVEHDMHAVFALADMISVLDRGSVIANGGVDAIKNDTRVQEAYLGKSHVES